MLKFSLLANSSITILELGFTQEEDRQKVVHRNPNPQQLHWSDSSFGWEDCIPLIAFPPLPLFQTIQLVTELKLN